MEDSERGVLKIWNQVCETDPKYVKEVDMRGGFSAIDPQYQLKKATELWGPYGDGWGLKNMTFSTLECSGKMALVLEATFCYPDAQFPIAADMAYRVNDDCYKKLITSARSKALSWLGFNADIFLGKWEDNHYVQDMRTKHTSEDELREKIFAAVRCAETTASLQGSREKLDKLKGSGVLPHAVYGEGIQLIEVRTRELGGVPFPTPGQKPTQGLQSFLGKVEMCNTLEEIKELKAAIADDPTIKTEDRIEINAAIKQVFEELYSTDDYSE